LAAAASHNFFKSWLILLVASKNNCFPSSPNNIHSHTRAAMASHTAAAPFVFSSRHARKAPTRGGGVSRGSRSGRGAAVVTAALADVPANEVAGFIIGVSA
jgi:hypothetical protein